MNANSVIQSLKKLEDGHRAKLLQRFFKTGKGQYAEGDIFLGIKVPILREVAKEFKILPFLEIKKLLKSGIHECRSVAIFIMIDQFKKVENQKKIFDFCMASTKYINNWDLADMFAPRIAGAYLNNKSKNILYEFAESNNLWKKRISIVATGYFIWQNNFKDTIKISKILLSDKHDLIHKAVGWMLREVGKRDEGLLRKFIDTNIQKMSRTTLRYSIEKFPEEFRQYYLKK
jgi:3-methyladenine DNA glycosylase AlkD